MTYPGSPEAQLGLATADIRTQIAKISLDNIAKLANQALDPTSPVLPLWFGEGDVATPEFVGDAALAAIRAGHTFYSQQNGVPELRTTLADYYHGLYGVEAPADRFTVTGGGMQAIMLAVQLVVDPGDNVVVIDPVWPNITGILQIMGAESRSVSMDYGRDGWSLDIDRLREICDGRTKAIFFASPGNPTGAILPPETLAQLLSFARAAGIWLIADEVYHRLVFGQRCGPSMITMAQPEDRVLIINSFSKSYAMTGWRLGWLVHPPSLAPTLAMMTQYTSSGTSTFLQHAGVAAIRRGEPFIATMNAYCADGCEIVCSAMESMSRVRMAARPTAGMYVFFEIDGMPESKAACLEILAKTNVGLAPGMFFGPGSKSFVRICFCRQPTVLHDAMQRLRVVLN